MEAAKSSETMVDAARGLAFSPSHTHTPRRLNVRAGVGTGARHGLLALCDMAASAGSLVAPPLVLAARPARCETGLKLVAVGAVLANALSLCTAASDGGN